MAPVSPADSTPAPRQPGIPRRATLARGALALAAASVLAACGSGRVATTRPAPAPTPRPRTDIQSLAEASPDLVVAGDQLDTDLLRRFYARHGYRPVWQDRTAKAISLANAVLRANEHGMDPDLFHGTLLRRLATFPPERRELLLSHAVLSYAQALATGAVPADRRRDTEALTPDPIDVTAVLDTALDSPDPVTVIEALAPSTPTYRALRQALRNHRPPPIFRGRATAPDRRRDIEVNLERQRWLPRRLPPDRVWVNVTDQKLTLFQDDQPAFTTRVIVGEETDRKQSPEFRATIEAGFYNPPWVVPRDIVERDILPRLEREPDYLERHDMILRDNGEAEQRPGPNAGLGVIMFDMPNRFDVYLHDTPDRQLFNRPNRRISNGCIRVENPREFTALLMQKPVDAVNEEIATGTTTRKRLPTPVPVFVIYQTAFVEAEGPLQFRPDFYNRDAGVWQALRAAPEA